MNAPVYLAPITVREANRDDPADRARILSFLASCPRAELFHSPEWLDAVADGCKQHSHYLLACESDGSISGALPLTMVRSRLFGSALVSTGFGVGGGILAHHEVAAEALGKAAWELAQSSGLPSVELRGGPIPQGYEEAVPTYSGFVRDLPGDEEAILKAIPRKQRAEVRKSLSLGLEVETGRGELLRAAHYRVYAESVRNLGSPVFPRKLFEAMLDQFGDAADLMVVRYQGRPVASVLSFYFRGTVYPYWGGGTRHARDLRANELLYFALMKHASARGCTRFDFGRSKIGTGAWAYKKNWGFDPVPLRYSYRAAGGSDMRSVNPLDAKYRMKVAIWRRMPLWAANLVGPFLAQGLG